MAEQKTVIPEAPSWRGGTKRGGPRGEDAVPPQLLTPATGAQEANPAVVRPEGGSPARLPAGFPAMAAILILTGVSAGLVAITLRRRSRNAPSVARGKPWNTNLDPRESGMAV